MPDETIKLTAIKEPSSSVFLRPSMNENTKPQINPNGKPLKNNAKGLSDAGKKANAKSANSAKAINAMMMKIRLSGFISAMNFMPQNFANI